MSGAEIKDSFNCGSATDIATGRFTVALTNDMSDVNYAVTSSAISHADSNVGSNRTSGATSYQAGDVYINGMITSTGNNNDVASCAFTASGDLA
jgi:phage baseplate assembly protein gpV